jgi:hypothetical protein
MELVTMTYRFQSRVTSDVLMLESGGDAVLAAMGIPLAPRGIIEPPAMPAALRAVELALAQEPPAGTDSVPSDGSSDDATAVSLRQRAWPLIDMLKRSHEANVPIVWGV